MHKKLERDLMSLAHSVLQMKNKEDVIELKEKAKDLYEKLSVLSFVEEYIKTTPNLTETKEELVDKIEDSFLLKEAITEHEAVFETEVETTTEAEELPNKINETVIEEVVTDEIISNKDVIKEEEIEQPFDELETLMFSTNDTAVDFKNDVKDVAGIKNATLEEELKDTLSVDLMADLFETAQPIKSLNDKLSSNIQIDLNDRIAFVKNLFDNNQEDYNRVVSQLNTFKTKKEANKFIINMVKPDYNWSEHEELEARFIEIIERKFA
ncbi:hypothetical protein [uncultured Polaribacter sp.]|uniref:hypothetical protein n=1 Tax=uncultured Polaribacter sp. TaxID=174711 RepID=UPI0026027791|nr:hypothetical protein [uncultured Polaribacter sp.]